MSDMIEACLNLWLVIDEPTGLIYRGCARAYALSGTDRDKSRILKELATSDFHLASHLDLTNYKTTVVDQHGPGRSTAGVLSARTVDALLPRILDQACQALEREFVQQPVLTDSRNSTSRMTFQADPYFVLTFLLEDERGRLRQAPAER